MSTPFTYLIGWPEQNKFYYGSRYRPGCEPSDLWTIYFTSSKEVQKLRAELGEPPLRQIRRTFTSVNEAREWEHKVLRRMKAPKRSDFLNLTTAKCPSMLGKTHSQETRDRIKNSQKGRPKNPASILKMRQTQLKRIAEGYSDSEATRLKKSSSHKGLVFSEEHRANIRADKLGRKHWNKDGVGKCSRECPGTGWVLGKLSHKRKKGAEAPS